MAIILFTFCFISVLTILWSFFVRLSIFFKIRELNGFAFDKSAMTEFRQLFFYLNLPYQITNGFKEKSASDPFVKKANLFAKITWFAWGGIVLTIIGINLLKSFFNIHL